jgi:CTP synthase
VEIPEQRPNGNEPRGSVGQPLHEPEPVARG